MSQEISRSVNGEAPLWVSTQIDKFLDNEPLFNVSSGLEEKSLGNYTKPELRERIKNRIMAGSKGGRPGQWSARKAQLLAIEYRKAGGGYRGKKTSKQRSLSKWTREKWTTMDGKPAKRKGGMWRYLPAKAWARLTPEQRKATNRKKLAGDKAGRQFVSNTSKARTVGANVRKGSNK